MNKELIGKRIKDEREKSGLTQGDLAEKVGWNSHQTVLEVEAGRREVKAWELAKIAQALHVEMHALLEEQAAPERPYVLWRERPSLHAEVAERKFLQRCEEYQFLETL